MPWLSELQRESIQVPFPATGKGGLMIETYFWAAYAGWFSVAALLAVIARAALDIKKILARILKILRAETEPDVRQR